MYLTFKKPSRLPFLSAGVAAMALLCLAPGAQAEESGAAFNAAQKKEIESVIQAYILDNPDVLLRSLQAGQAKEAEQRQLDAQAAISGNLKALTDANAPSIGNPNADVTIVEFFDYNCGYCKRALPDIQNILKADSNVRFVFREMPILGPTSQTAAQWALAAHKQGKYFDYHVALMNHKGPKNEEVLAKIAKDTGLDVERLRKDAQSEAVQAEIERDVALARSIGISGTPAFIVGETLIPGYVGEDGLKQSIEDARADTGKDG